MEAITTAFCGVPIEADAEILGTRWGCFPTADRASTKGAAEAAPLTHDAENPVTKTRLPRHGRHGKVSNPVNLPRRSADLGTIGPKAATHPVAALVGVGAYVCTETTFEMVMTMTTIDEQAAVLALTKATHTQPWHHTARAIASAGSALKLMDGDVTGLDETDQAHAADLRSRVSIEDLEQARDLITTMRVDDIHLLTVLDDTYPGNMLWANNYQPFVWVRGRMTPEDFRAVAIVGEHDSALAAAAAGALAEAGLTVIAPLRSDLDAAVHEAVFDTGGRTLGVLAGGMAAPDVLGPYASVAQQIGQRGALVSPFWPDTTLTDRTIAQERIVTCGLAATVYIVDGGDDGPGHRCTEMVLKTGKHVFVPQRLQQEHSWVTQVGFRGGITVVQDTDDLSKHAVNLVDMCSQTTMF